MTFLSDDFDEQTKLVLVNAIYFSGMWLKKFDVKETQKKTFHTARGEKKMVATMFNKSTYNYGKIPLLDAKFIEIPYMVRPNVHKCFRPIKLKKCFAE